MAALIPGAVFVLRVKMRLRPADRQPVSGITAHRDGGPEGSQTTVQAGLLRPDISVTIGTLDDRRIYYSRSRSTFRRLPAPGPRHLSPRAIRARDLVVHRSTIRPPVTTSRMISVVPITVAT